MNDSIKPGSNAVSSLKLVSKPKAKEAPKRAEKEPQREAVDSVVSNLGKARESVDKIAETAGSRIEVIKQNEASSKTKVEDLDQALKLSKDLELNIKKNEDQARQAHDFDALKAKELLK